MAGYLREIFMSDSEQDDSNEDLIEYQHQPNHNNDYGDPEYEEIDIENIPWFFQTRFLVGATIGFLLLFRALGSYYPAHKR